MVPQRSKRVFMRLVSACLVGINCKWKGGNSLNEKVYEEFKKGDLFPVCPEVLGGQSIAEGRC